MALFNQVGGPTIFRIKPQAITPKPGVPRQALAAAAAADARSVRHQSLVMLLILMAILVLSCTPVKAASPQDRAFMRHEIQASTYELDFARLGLARALRPEIRAYAETLINDHTRHNEALRDLARSKNVSLPSTMGRHGKQRLDRLGSTPDSAFDAAFLREARRINGDGVRGFRVEASRTADPEIRAFVLRFLDVDKKHQSLARSLSNILVASRAVVIRPPQTGDPIIVVPAPDKSPMPIIQPPSNAQPVTPGRD